jgi:cyclopropane-fatty-acyl-phospholipid synthase
MNKSAIIDARSRRGKGAPMPALALMAMFKGMKAGKLTLRLPTGDTCFFEGSEPGGNAELHIVNWRACSRILRYGDIGFAEAYRDGWVESPDLAKLIKLAIANAGALDAAVDGSWLGRAWHNLMHRLRPNTKAGSRRNIHAHYDLGNAFYGLWLDPTWTYSGAWFQGDFSRSLREAQDAKYQRIVDILDLKPGMRVLEIGCGWGGFALHAASRGVEVHGVTISRAQLQAGSERIRAAGLESLANLEFCDYRDLGGEYDAVVSIEMFEAVGEAFWPEYFNVIQRRLKPNGRALVQSITIDHDRFNAYRRSSDFIREYIFPGGMLPSPAVFSMQAGNRGLQVIDAFAFGGDYAETLRRWRDAFERHLPTIRKQGFDEAFIRLWRLYFQYCEAGFDAGSIDLYQFTLRRDD